MTAPLTDREDLTINGVSLDTLCYGLTDVSKIFTVPGRRGTDVVVPGRHGAIRTKNKRFNPGQYVLPLWIAGSNPDGTVPVGSTDGREFYKRRDELLNIFYATDVLVAFTRPDGHTVQAHCEVDDVIDFTRRFNEPLAKISVSLTNTAAFWADESPVTQTITGQSGVTEELTVFAGATAPITDLTITFPGLVHNPMLEHGHRTFEFGATVAADQQLVINTGTWTPSPGTGSAWSPDLRQAVFAPGPEWFALDPATSPFAVTFRHTTGGGAEASATITGRRTYLSA